MQLNTEQIKELLEQTSIDAHIISLMTESE